MTGPLTVRPGGSGGRETGHSEEGRARASEDVETLRIMPGSRGEELSITIRRGGVRGGSGLFLQTGAPQGGVLEISSVGPLGGLSSLRGGGSRGRTVSRSTHFSLRRLVTVSSTPPRGSFRSSWRFQPSALLTGRASPRAGRARHLPWGGARARQAGRRRGQARVPRDGAGSIPGAGRGTWSGWARGAGPRSPERVGTGPPAPAQGRAWRPG